MVRRGEEKPVTARRELPPPLEWRKSRHGDPGGECIEMAATGDGAILLRNSRDRDGYWLVSQAAEVADFLAGVKAGDFDPLVEDPPGT